MFPGVLQTSKIKSFATIVKTVYYFYKALRRRYLLVLDIPLKYPFGILYPFSAFLIIRYTSEKL